jgi:hypothetical protein
MRQQRALSSHDCYPRIHHAPIVRRPSITSWHDAVGHRTPELLAGAVTTVTIVAVVAIGAADGKPSPMPSCMSGYGGPEPPPPRGVPWKPWAQVPRG